MSAPLPSLRSAIILTVAGLTLSAIILGRAALGVPTEAWQYVLTSFQLSTMVGLWYSRRRYFRALRTLERQRLMSAELEELRLLALAKQCVSASPSASPQKSRNRIETHVSIRASEVDRYLASDD